MLGLDASEGSLQVGVSRSETPIVGSEEAEEIGKCDVSRSETRPN